MLHPLFPWLGVPDLTGVEKGLTRASLTPRQVQKRPRLRMIVYCTCLVGGVRAQVKLGVDLGCPLLAWTEEEREVLPRAGPWVAKMTLR